MCNSPFRGAIPISAAIIFALIVGFERINRRIFDFVSFSPMLSPMSVSVKNVTLISPGDASNSGSFLPASLHAVVIRSIPLSRHAFQRFQKVYTPKTAKAAATIPMATYIKLERKKLAV